jgi:hypothetical protein
MQSRGSARIGMLIGPVMSVWFVALAFAELWQATQTPAVFGALDPRHGLGFLFGHGWTSFLALRSVFFVLTGAGALYADSTGSCSPMAYRSKSALAPLTSRWFSLTGELVTEDELLALVWLGIFVDAANLKVQVSALRNALGKTHRNALDFSRLE